MSYEHNVKIELKNLICSTCEHLTYWDRYICELQKHTTNKGFLHMGTFKNCNDYVKRIGDNYPECVNQECMFWCLECTTYKKHKDE